MMGRVREEAGPVNSTVDPADIRGLATTLLKSVGHLPRSRHEGRRQPPPNAVEGCAEPGPRLFPDPVGGWATMRSQAGRVTSRAMAHMKAASSRAMATTATLGCLPRASSLR